MKRERFEQHLVEDSTCGRDINLSLNETPDVDSDYDSLFDADDVIAFLDSPKDDADKCRKILLAERPARRTAPPVPGLFFNSAVRIPAALADQLWESCMGTYFRNRDVNQVMLFERARASRSVPVPSAPNADDKNISPNSANAISPANAEPGPGSRLGLPGFLLELLDVLDTLLRDDLPPEIHALLFPRDDESGQARQVILNHYMPGEGITPHVDLLKRYGDGIIGVSLHSGCVMRFAKASSDANLNGPARSRNEKNEEMRAIAFEKPIGLGTDARAERSDIGNEADSEQSVYLPARSIIVMSGEARYAWTHGISQLTEDLIESGDGNSTARVPRGERLSITYRWFLPGADVVGA